jgi:hypothetical protein
VQERKKIDSFVDGKGLLCEQYGKNFRVKRSNYRSLLKIGCMIDSHLYSGISSSMAHILTGTSLTKQLRKEEYDHTTMKKFNRKFGQRIEVKIKRHSQKHELAQLNKQIIKKLSQREHHINEEIEGEKEKYFIISNASNNLPLHNTNLFGISSS